MKSAIKKKAFHLLTMSTDSTYIEMSFTQIKPQNVCISYLNRLYWGAFYMKILRHELSSGERGMAPDYEICLRRYDKYIRAVLLCACVFVSRAVSDLNFY